ncbi:MAG: hypothetical protein AAGG68_07565 [Bacteroidota bacterium]
MKILLLKSPIKPKNLLNFFRTNQTCLFGGLNSYQDATEESQEDSDVLFDQARAIAWEKFQASKPHLFL